MKYKVLELIKTINWEGIIFEDEKGNKKMTSGIKIWEARPERIAKCEIINSINMTQFMNKWNDNFNNIELIF